MEVQNALRDKVVSSICAMDVRMLDAILPDHGRYEDTYKEEWLEKLISFFKTCKMKGDTSLTVHNGQCVARNLCSCRQKLWIFNADKTNRGFAIYFEVEGDEIKGIKRCFGHYNNDREMTQLNDVFNYEGYFVHEHEKIGFIDTYELKETRRKVKLFMADMGNPRRHTVGVIGIKRMVRKYNSLYFDVVYQPDLYEYKIAMLNMYEDLCNLKNIFTQRKSFELVAAKCNELMDCDDVKSKTKLLKWFLKNKQKVSKYLIFYNTIEVEENRTWFYYRIDDKEHRLIIHHPNINIDVDACILLQIFIMPFYDYLQNEYLKKNTLMAHVDSERVLYNYFKDILEQVLEPCEEWIGVWF